MDAIGAGLRDGLDDAAPLSQFLSDGKGIPRERVVGLFRQHPAVRECGTGVHGLSLVVVVVSLITECSVRQAGHMPRQLTVGIGGVLPCQFCLVPTASQKSVP